MAVNNRMKEIQCVTNKIITFHFWIERSWVRFKCTKVSHNGERWLLGVAEGFSISRPRLYSYGSCMDLCMDIIICFDTFSIQIQLVYPPYH